MRLLTSLNVGTKKLSFYRLMAGKDIELGRASYSILWEVDGYLLKD